MIPDEAVEAAAIAVYGRKDVGANLMRRILEAAAPHMLPAQVRRRPDFYEDTP